jgi:CheY-like chemotaxis protein
VLATIIAFQSRHSTEELQQGDLEEQRMTDQGEQTDSVGGKVLIVDDNLQNLELLQAYLEELPVETLTATDGVEAMRMVAEHNPDLILLDIMMPKMSGFEVCDKLKANPETKDIPVIMITALNEISDIERGVESGTDDFLTKPVNKLELLTRVKSLLRLRHLKNELERTLAYLADLEMRRPE